MWWMSLLQERLMCSALHPCFLLLENPCTQVLRTILPPTVPVPTSFESAGHIAHLNLLDVHLPYRHIIAQVPSSTLSCRRTSREPSINSAAQAATGLFRFFIWTEWSAAHVLCGRYSVEALHMRKLVYCVLHVHFIAVRQHNVHLLSSTALQASLENRKSQALLAST